MAFDEKSFLGRGWSFPPTFDRATGEVVLANEKEDIEQSLYILFTTIPGERIMRPRFGCNLFSQVFNQINTTTETYIRGLIADAILDFEPRITLEDIQFDIHDALEGVLYIQLTYTIRKTNTRTNMVYPFYTKEGTDIQPL